MDGSNGSTNGNGHGNGNGLVIPWYQSGVIKALAVALLAHLFADLHLTKQFTDADTTKLVDDLFDWLEVISIIKAGHSRVTGVGAQIALRKLKPDTATVKDTTP